jgi:putative DNA primase/helicase
MTEPTERPFPEALSGLAWLRRWILWERLYKGGDPADRKNWDKIARPVAGPTPARTLRRREQTEWATLGEAWAVLMAPGAWESGLTGLGWAPKAEDGLVFIDIDECRDPATGEISASAQAVVKACGSYAEISPSGTGIRVIGGSRGWRGAGKDRFRWTDGLRGEVYHDWGYVTITRNWLDGYGNVLGEVGAVAQALVDDEENEAQREKERSGRRALDPDRERTAEIEVVRALLAMIPNEGKADWDRWVVEVGLPTWAATEGSDDGLSAWEEWSRRCPDYGVKFECEDAWWKIGRSPPSEVGAGKLEILAKAAAVAAGREWAPPAVVKGWLDEVARRKAEKWSATWSGGGPLERIEGWSSGDAPPWWPRSATAPAPSPARVTVAASVGAAAVPARASVWNPPVLSAASPRLSAEKMVEMEWQGGEGGRGVGRWLHHEGSEWMEWDERRYVSVPEEVIRGLTWDFLHRARTTVVDRKGGATVEPFSPTKAKVANVMEALAGVVQLRDGKGEGWPRWREGVGIELGGVEAGRLIVFRNGLLDVETGRMAAHTPAFLNRVALPYDWLGYGPENGGCEGWLEFLGGLWPGDPESVGVLQEMTGLFMTGDTGFQKAFMLVGPRRSGKGTIVRVIRQLLGEDNAVAPTLSTLGDQFGLQPLLHKRLAVISDVRMGRRTDGAAAVERLLAITGEDAVSVPRKNRDSWTGKMEVRFLMTANKPPKLDDASGAIMGRFVMLTLRKSWFGQEDMGLGDKLARELPGIAAWALAGLRRLRTRGRIETPAAAREMEQEFRDLGDPIGEWLKEECEVGEGFKESRDGMYLRWMSWCRLQGWTSLWTKQMFGRNLRAALPEVRDERTREIGADGREIRMRFYLGLRPRGSTGALSEAVSNVIPMLLR